MTDGSFGGIGVDVREVVREGSRWVGAKSKVKWKGKMCE